MTLKGRMKGRNENDEKGNILKISKNEVGLQWLVDDWKIVSTETSKDVRPNVVHVGGSGIGV